MQKFPKLRKSRKLTAFRLNPTVSTLNEERVLETDRDNNGKVVLDRNRSLEKRYLNFLKLLFKKDSSNNTKTKKKKYLK